MYFIDVILAIENFVWIYKERSQYSYDIFQKLCTPC